MKQHLFSVSTLVLAVALVLSACSKEGPAGPAGPQGPAGPTGAAGAAGVAGPAGTANVIYSAWLDGTFTEVTDGTDSYFADTLLAPKLDASILATGMVKVYMNFGTTAAPDITLLPDLFFAQINPYFSVGRIELISGSNFSTVVDNQNQKRLQLRYLLIPGGVPARYDVNWSDYRAVQKLFNLKD
jgi:hypothetical protein